MADKCYNIFRFFGNKAVQDQVNAWYVALEKVCMSNKDLCSPNSLFDVFLPNEERNSLTHFGQKWAYPDFGVEISLNPNEIGVVSSWGSLNGLQDLLTAKLTALDINVVVLNMYSSAEFKEAFRYTAIASDGKIKSEGSYLMPADDSDEDGDFDYLLFYEQQEDCISDLIDQVPGIKKNLSKELKRVQKLFSDAFQD